jgi:hypothetical protein
MFRAAGLVAQIETNELGADAAAVETAVLTSTP